MKENEIVHGYKVFRSDWTCSPNGNTKQYVCPGTFEEDGELYVCEHGMHFCEKASDCFSYYNFDSDNKVAEVFAYGRVVKEGNMSCTDKLEIVREIPWEEVLRIVNIGKKCTGIGNTGDRNNGNLNTGHWNTGDKNTGNHNTGGGNTGNKNTGHWNTGNFNTGDFNTGSLNTGHHNTGFGNTGDFNTGDFNTGNHNTGFGNTGNWNTGDFNTGNKNTGDWNKSSFNNGCFMTEVPKIHLFNKPSDWTYRDWLNSKARNILKHIPIDTVELVFSYDMTDEEKKEYPTHETTGGYLKVIDESDHRQLWWGSLTDAEKNIIKALPNFDPVIFKECTGIDVDR